MAEPTPGTVEDVVAQTARRHGGRPAIIRTDGEVVCTHGQLLERTADVSRGLRRLGVSAGDVVLVTVPAAAEMLIATLGSMGAGVCAPMNPAYTATELNELVEVLQPAAVIVLDGSGGPTEQVAVRHGIPLLKIGKGGILGDRLNSHAGQLGQGMHEPSQPSDVALVLHTAGTTAKPKQVPLTHANLVTAAGNVVKSLQLVPDDRCLNVMPLFHSHGLLGAALSTVLAGASIV